MSNRGNGLKQNFVCIYCTNQFRVNLSSLNFINLSKTYYAENQTSRGKGCRNCLTYPKNLSYSFSGKSLEGNNAVMSIEEISMRDLKDVVLLHAQFLL